MEIKAFFEHILFIHVFAMALGNWRISSLVANENGPWHVFRKFRALCLRWCKQYRWCEELYLYELVECEWCNSMWFCTVTMTLWFFFGDIVPLVLMVPALSACVIFIKMVIQNLEKILDR